MKTKFLLLLCYLFVAIVGKAQSDEQQTVTLTQAGTLAQQLGGTMYSVKNLKVIGEINGSDIKVLRYMCGAVDEAQPKDGDEDEISPMRTKTAVGESEYKLSILDLSEAKIVKGGSAYYYDWANQYDKDEYEVTEDVNIPKYMFLSCPNIKQIIMPENAKSIGYMTFRNCTGLVSLTMGNNVETVDEYCFYGCSKLVSVKLSTKLKSIGSDAFDECESLASIVFPDSLETVGKFLFTGCTNLKSIIFGKKLTGLSYKMFWGCSALESLDLSSTNIKTIGQYVFSGCTSLKTLKLPSSLEEIPSNAFSDCKSLMTVDIPEGVKTIGSDAFYNCIALKSISIPNSVTTLSGSAFSFCKGLEQITLGTGIKGLEPSLFNYCTSLKEISLPDNVTYIGDEAFYRCLSLKKVSLNKTSSIGEGAFKFSGLEEITLPDGVTEVGQGGFANCESLKSFTSGKNLKIMPKDMLSGDSVLVSVSLPEGLEEISSYCLEKCVELTSLTLPASIKQVDDVVAEGCNKITKVTCFAVEPPTSNYSYSKPFEDIDVNADLYVPAQSVEKYKKDNYWKGFKSIHAITQAGIADVTADGENVTIVAIYDVCGKLNKELVKGMNIVKMSDGTIRKMFVK